MEAKRLMCPRVIPLLALLFVALMANGQNLEIPKNEFALSSSRNLLELSRGENTEVEILILKSKGYRNSKVKMGISSQLPMGVAITFNPDKGNFYLSRVNILIQSDASPGLYTLILNATLNNKTKGTILKLLIK